MFANPFRKKSSESRTLRSMLKVDNTEAFWKSFHLGRKPGESYEQFRERQRTQTKVLRWLQRRRIKTTTRNGKQVVTTIP